MGKRDELTTMALLRGKRFTGAPSLEKCIQVCQRFEFLSEETRHGHEARVRRATGDLYRQMVNYILEWRVSKTLKEVLDDLCPISECKHVEWGLSLCMMTGSRRHISWPACLIQRELAGSEPVELLGQDLLITEAARYIDVLPHKKITSSDCNRIPFMSDQSAYYLKHCEDS